MFGFLGKLFGSDQAASSLINNISSGLDKIYYSKQEQAEDLAEAQSEARGLLIRWLEATQGSNLARRLIALIVTGIWAIQYTTSMILLALLPWFDTYADKMRESAISLQESGSAVGGAMMLVLGFYFAAPHLGSIVEKAMNKFSGSNKKE